MTVQIRPFTERDYAALIAVHNAALPDYTESEVDVRHYDAARDPQCHFLRVVAERDGLVVGFASYGNVSFMFHPQKFWLDIEVHPEYHGQGIEAALYDHLMADAAPREPILFWSNSREDWAERMAFLAERGFAEKMRYYESRLDLTSFDASRFAGASERAAEQGITIKTLRELEADPDRDRKLFEFHSTVVRDVPSPGETNDITYEAWHKRTFENPSLLPDGFFMALDGERYVGISNLWEAKGRAHINTGLTGVLREYRRRGIALALKLRAIEYARQVGATHIRTGNEENNRAMLSINEALGFAKQPPWIDFIKQVRAE
jgi:mycothiol synthase